jgi:hypothetical protein
MRFSLRIMATTFLSTDLRILRILRIMATTFVNIVVVINCSRYNS